MTLTPKQTVLAVARVYGYYNDFPYAAHWVINAQNAFNHTPLWVKTRKKKEEEHGDSNSNPLPQVSN